MANAANHRHRIVVIDADHDLRNGVLHRCAGEGWDVVGAADRSEALGHLDGEPCPCVIFLDPMMPGMDGWRFMSELLVWPNLRAVPIVVVSSCGTPQSVQWLGATEYLRKPFPATRAVEIVQELCPSAVLAVSTSPRADVAEGQVENR